MPNMNTQIIDDTQKVFGRTDRSSDSHVEDTEFPEAWISTSQCNKRNHEKTMQIAGSFMYWMQ